MCSHLLQFVNVSPEQPHLQQQSLGNGSDEPAARILLLFLTSREACAELLVSQQRGD